MKFPSDHVLIYDRLLVMAGMLDAACNLEGWAFYDNQHVCFSEHESEFLALLQINGCLNYMKSHTTKKLVPHILSDRLGLMWLAETMPDEHSEVPGVVIVFGPFFCSNLSPKAFESTLRAMNLSYVLIQQFMSVFNDVPVLNEQTIQRFAKMLHYCMTNEKLSSVDIHYQEDDIRQKEEDILTQDSDILCERGRTAEALILQSIREGNISVEELLRQIRGTALTVRFNSGIPLRDEKDIVIINTALCSRAAMEGGLSPKLAQRLEEVHIRKVEMAQSVTQLANVNREMMADFLDAVHRARQNAGLSAVVQECIIFVQANLTTPFTLTDLARSVGYTEYYLTRKFKKETGENLTDYIRKVRLERAKILLRTTNQTIQSISEQFQFGTRNYFTRVFRNETGMTPAQYRQGNKGDRE